MINKIHSNVKQMLAEARIITQRHHSVHKLLPEAPRERNKVEWSFNYSQRQKSVEPTKKMASHLQTEPDTDYVKRKRTITEHTDHKPYLSREEKRALLPDQSQLLSTKLYGFQKRSSPSKQMEEDFLPKLNNKVQFQIKTNVLRQNAKKGKYLLMMSSHRKETLVSNRTIEKLNKSEINRSRRRNIDLKQLRIFQQREPIKLDCDKLMNQDIEVNAWQLNPRFREEYDEFSL